MGTNLNLMFQANCGPADPKNWDFDTEILVSVIPFLQHLGVNPETDAGTVGRLIDSDANDVRGREAAIHRLTGYLVRRTCALIPFKTWLNCLASDLLFSLKATTGLRSR